MNRGSCLPWAIPVLAWAFPVVICAQTEAPPPADSAKPAAPAKPVAPANGAAPDRKADAPIIAQRQAEKQVEKQAATSDSPASGLTPQHKLFEPLDGEWKVTVSFHGFGDQTPPPSKSKITFKSILDGRFLMENAEVPMMGSKFKWVGIYGYDAKAKKFTAVWADNGDDTHDLATGTHDATTNTFTFSGERDDPRTGGKSAYKWTIRLHPPNELTVEMYEPDEKGEEKLVMRIMGLKE